VEIWRDGGAVVVLVDDPWLAGVLPELRRAGVDRIDVLVLRRGGRRVAGAVVDLRSRVDVRLVLAPVGHRSGTLRSRRSAPSRWGPSR
jgi:hypothetical protein